MFVDLALAPRILCSVVFTVNTRLQGAPPPHVELNNEHLYAVNYIKMKCDPSAFVLNTSQTPTAVFTANNATN